MLAQLVDPNNDIFDLFCILGAFAAVISAFLVGYAGQPAPVGQRWKGDPGTVLARLALALLAAGLLFL